MGGGNAVVAFGSRDIQNDMYGKVLGRNDEGISILNIGGFLSADIEGSMGGLVNLKHDVISLENVRRKEGLHTALRTTKSKTRSRNDSENVESSRDKTGNATRPREPFVLSQARIRQRSDCQGSQIPSCRFRTRS